MQLFSALNSPFGLGVEIFISMAFPAGHCMVRHLSLESGETQEEWFRKINPRGLVPVLVDEEFTLSESTSILRFLAQSHQKNHSFYPMNPRKRASIDEWVDSFSSSYGWGLWWLFCSVEYPDRVAEYSTLLKRAEAKWLTQLDEVESYLGRNQWFGQENISIADCYLGGLLLFAEQERLIPENYENTKAWLQRPRPVDRPIGLKLY